MIKEKVKLISKKDICDGVVEFEFERPESFDFKVGQYVNLYIPGAEVAHGKSYTIISSPDEKTLKFAIRKRGPFSQYLHSLEKGGEMILEGPEGNFFFEDFKEGLIFIGAGIGVAPLISYLRYLNSTSNVDIGTHSMWNKIKVLISNKTKSSTPYLEDLKKIDTNFFFTAENGKRIDEDSVRKVIEGNDLPVFICGSINFTNDFWKILRKLEVKDERIITEAFF